MPDLTDAQAWFLYSIVGFPSSEEHARLSKIFEKSRTVMAQHNEPAIFLTERVCEEEMGVCPFPTATFILVNDLDKQAFRFTVEELGECAP